MAKEYIVSIFEKDGDQPEVSIRLDDLSLLAEMQPIERCFHLFLRALFLIIRELPPKAKYNALQTVQLAVMKEEGEIEIDKGQEN